ncbi:hypothetical protein H8B02_38775 [Bradyrhizobium sp. Pear77]|uniref:hypothetical protein n=1 Tax=Bradyrhizobium altum TaxID=1571202 RepID=UPI001E613B56|nr:hypothetical protein [Bradyrhizobium altum]MCC8959138.1 hypothetical protein [Bradyrhizobium altum]
MLLFRWRVEFGVAKKKRARLASVALPDNTVATRFLRLPEGMMAVDLPDGGVSLLPIGSDPDVVRARSIARRRSHAHRRQKLGAAPAGALFIATVEYWVR